MVKYIHIPIGKTANGATLALPNYDNDSASYMNIYAAIPNRMRIKPGAIEHIKTGIGIGIPKGYECLITSNYEKVLDHGMIVLGAPLAISSTFRDELIVPIENKGKETIVINRGDVIANLTINEVQQIIWQEV